jgi:hypothetical protein
MWEVLAVAGPQSCHGDKIVSKIRAGLASGEFLRQVFVLAERVRNYPYL